MSSVAPEASLPMAGWYPDPEFPGNDRWWDGAAWTDHRRVDAGAAIVPAASGWAQAPAAASPVPAEARNTLAIVGFVLSASSIVVPLLLNALAGGIVSAIALSRSRRLAADGALSTGRGFALAGVLIGFIWAGLCLLGIALIIAVGLWIAAVTQNVNDSPGPIV